VAANWAKVSQTIEPNERPLYVPTLVRTSADPRMAAKLQAFAAANIPASDQGDVRKAVAGVDYRAKVKAERLPQIDRWLAEGN
jgi:aminopeptidase N